MDELSAIGELSITLNSPITDEQWDMITDVDFDKTNNIFFHTKHGKDVEFIKVRRAEWIDNGWLVKCSNCGEVRRFLDWKFCPVCGSIMEG